MSEENSNGEGPDFEEPDATDFHGQKRELLRKGVEEGKLTWEEITDAFDEEHLTDTELEVFLFTCENMNIEVEGGPE
ncbi:MAG: RNA polymerase sigma factor region1.1 domain-containing protein [Bradymonadaceae bacterium]